MLMLSHAHEVSRQDLRTISTPEPTNSWRPVPHSTVVDVLLERVAARGLEVKAERYAVLPGKLYSDAGAPFEIPGAKLFGSLDFAPVKGMPFPPGCTPSAGLRNSHDKSFSLSILSGARVFVCANGVLSAEHCIARKHTSGLELGAMIDMAMDAFMQSISGFQRMYEHLQSQQLSTRRAHSTIIHLAQAGAFSSSDILPVVAAFEQPSHPEFKDRNMWTLYQAATEVMKKQSPIRQVDGLKALNGVMMPHLN